MRKASERGGRASESKTCRESSTESNIECQSARPADGGLGSERVLGWMGVRVWLHRSEPVPACNGFLNSRRECRKLATVRTNTDRTGWRENRGSAADLPRSLSLPLTPFGCRDWRGGTHIPPPIPLSTAPFPRTADALVSGFFHHNQRKHPFTGMFRADKHNPRWQVLALPRRSLPLPAK